MTILHIDMDAFFASVEEVEKPYLKGLPIVVGGDPKGGTGRGVVSTASYAARVYGIRSALPISTAWKLSEKARAEGKPPVVFITPTMGRYSSVSKKIFAMIEGYVSAMDIVSVDEAYLKYEGGYEGALALGAHIRDLVQTEFGLPLSVGIGPNKMIAKLATELGKPNGLKLIREDEVYDVMSPMPVGAIPGIGRKTEAALLRQGIRTVADLRNLSFAELERICGSFGFTLFERVRGIASKTVGVHEEQKSIGEMETFDVDIHTPQQVLPIVTNIAAHLATKMKNVGWDGFKKVAVTVRFSTFETYTRQKALSVPKSTARDIELYALPLILPFFDARENPRKLPIRLIGVRIEGRV